MEKLSLVGRTPSTSPIAVDPELVKAKRNIARFKARLKELFLGRPIQVNKPTLKDWHDLAENIMISGTDGEYAAPKVYTYGAFNRLMETVLARLGSPEFIRDHSAKLANLLTQSNSHIFLQPSVSLPPMIPPALRSEGSVGGESQPVPSLIHTLGREILVPEQKRFWQIQLAESSLIYVVNQKEAEAARISLTRYVLEAARDFSDEEPNPIFYLDSPEEISENLQELTVREGKYQLMPGRLRRILDTGGVIVINFEKFDAAATARLNSLFDDERKLDGIPLNPKVKIVGLLHDKSVIQGKKSEAFFSRWKHEENFSFRARELDPLVGLPSISAEHLSQSAARLTEPETTLQAYYQGRNESDLPLVQLYASAEWYANLVGKIMIKGSGFEVAEGALIRALKSGQNHLVVVNGAWENQEFRNFWQQILTEGVVHFNGVDYPIPAGFQVVKAEGYPEIQVQQARANKHLVIYDQPIRIPGQMYALNSANFLQYFGLSRVNEQRLLVEQPGIFASCFDSARDAILISSDLADWQWHQLLLSYSEKPMNIFLTSGVNVPEAYQDWVLGDRENHKRPVPELTNGFIAAQQPGTTFFLETSDTTLSLARIKHENPNVEIIDLNEETELTELMQDITVLRVGDHFQFVLSDSHLLSALAHGQTVVLRGLDAKQPIFGELASLLFGQPPYAMVNGERRNFPGRLIVLTSPDASVVSEASLVVKDQMPVQDTWSLLQAEYPRFPVQLFKSLPILFELINRLPDSGAEKRYPKETHLNYALLQKIGQMFSASSITTPPTPEEMWRVVKDAVLGEFHEASEAYAMLKVFGRLLLFRDDNHSVRLERLEKIVGQATSRADLEDHIWELASCFSTDVLRQLWPETSDDLLALFERPDSLSLRPDFTARLLNLIQDLLVNHYRGIQPARADYYQEFFGFSEHFATLPTLNTDRKDQEQRWEHRIQRCTAILARSRLLFLKGEPGVGKSFITSTLAARLNANTYGPITIGPTTVRSDVVSSRALIEGSVAITEKEILRWAKDREPHKPKFLVVDEANLSKDGFWDFLKGVFERNPYIILDGKKIPLTPDHRIIFTGNPERLPGRQYQQIVKEHGVTVFFEPYDNAFLAKKIIEPLLQNAKNPADSTALFTEMEQTEITGLMLWFFDQIKLLLPDTSFSPRDLEAFVLRIIIKNQIAKSSSRPINLSEIVASAAAEEFTGLLDENQEKVLKDWVQMNLRVQFLDQNELAPELQVEMERQDSSFAITPAVAGLCSSLDHDLAVREARVQGQLDSATYGRIGKHAILFEGPSGRGKDAAIIRTLKARGFVDGSDPANASVASQRKYYQINMGDAGKVKATIDKAFMEGSLVILDEVNTGAPGVAEGILNGPLTGIATEQTARIPLPGFMLIATENSSKLKGREELSSALKNRFHIEYLADYPEPELAAILAKRVPEPAARELSHWHVSLKQYFLQHGLRPIPTPRDAFGAAEMLRTGRADNLQTAIQQGYLRHIKQTEKSYEALAPLLQAHRPESHETDQVLQLTYLANLIYQRPEAPLALRTSPVLAATGEGYFDAKTHSLVLAADPSVQQRQVFFQANFARLTRPYPVQIPKPAADLQHTLETCRIFQYLNRNYPESIQGILLTPSELVEKNEAEITSTLNQLNPETAFTTIIEAYAKGELVANLASLPDLKPEISLAAGMAFQLRATVVDLLRSFPAEPNSMAIGQAALRAEAAFRLIFDQFLELQERLKTLAREAELAKLRQQFEPPRTTTLEPNREATPPQVALPLPSSGVPDVQSETRVTVDPKAEAAKLITDFKTKVRSEFGSPIVTNKPKVRDWYDLAAGILGETLVNTLVTPPLEKYTVPAVNVLLRRVNDLALLPQARLRDALTAIEGGRITLTEPQPKQEPVPALEQAPPRSEPPTILPLSPSSEPAFHQAMATKEPTLPLDQAALERDLNSTVAKTTAQQLSSEVNPTVVNPPSFMPEEGVAIKPFRAKRNVSGLVGAERQTQGPLVLQERSIGNSQRSHYFPDSRFDEVDAKGDFQQAIAPENLFETLPGIPLTDRHYLKADTVTLTAPTFMQHGSNFLAPCYVPLSMRPGNAVVVLKTGERQNVPIIRLQDGRWVIPLASEPQVIAEITYDLFEPMADVRYTPEQEQLVASRYYGPSGVIARNRAALGRLEYQLFPELDQTLSAFQDQSTKPGASQRAAVEAVVSCFQNTTYSKTPETLHEYQQGQNLVNTFLRIKAGVCYEAAVSAAMVVQDRLNLPARVVHGQTSAGLEISSEGHGWIEVYLKGEGWVKFDPTALNEDPATRQVLAQETPLVQTFLTERREQIMQQEVAPAVSQSTALEVAAVEETKAQEPEVELKTGDFSYPIYAAMQPVTERSSAKVLALPALRPIFAEHQITGRHFNTSSGTIVGARLLALKPDFFQQIITEAGLDLEKIKRVVLTGYPFSFSFPFVVIENPEQGYLFDQAFWETLLSKGIELEVYVKDETPPFKKVKTFDQLFTWIQQQRPTSEPATTSSSLPRVVVPPLPDLEAIMQQDPTADDSCYLSRYQINQMLETAARVYTSEVARSYQPEIAELQEPLPALPTDSLEDYWRSLPGFNFREEMVTRNPAGEIIKIDGLLAILAPSRIEAKSEILQEILNRVPFLDYLTIPEGFSPLNLDLRHLTHLRVLEITKNSWVGLGTILQSLKLPNPKDNQISRINFEQVDFTFSPDFSNCQKLEYLDLDGQLEAESDLFIQDLPRLTVLGLNVYCRNLIVANLKQLTNLSFCETRTTGSWHFANLPALEGIAIAKSYFHDSTLVLPTLPNLRKCSVQHDYRFLGASCLNFNVSFSGDYPKLEKLLLENCANVVLPPKLKPSYKLQHHTKLEKIVLPWLDEENKVTRDQLTKPFSGEIKSPEPPASLEGMMSYQLTYHGTQSIPVYFNKNTTVGELIQTFEDANPGISFGIVLGGNFVDSGTKLSERCFLTAERINLVSRVSLAKVVVVRSPEQLQVLKDQLQMDELPFEVQVEDVETEEPAPVPVTSFSAFYREFEASKARVIP